MPGLCPLLAAPGSTLEGIRLVFSSPFAVLAPLFHYHSAERYYPYVTTMMMIHSVTLLFDSLTFHPALDSYVKHAIALKSLPWTLTHAEDSPTGLLSL